MTIPETRLKLELKKHHTLPEIERMILSLSTTSEKYLDVWLASDLGAQLFKDSLIVGLLGFAAKRGINTRVLDWIPAPSDSRLQERFGTTLEGLAALEYANEIVDSQKKDLYDRVYKHRLAVVEKDGIATPEKTGGQSLTFCAFDPTMPIPIGFSNIDTRASFVRTFLNIRRDFFEVGVNQRIPEPIDDAVAGFVYELWQNSLQHGRLNESHEVIKGMRYLRVRKHVGFDRNKFIERAEGFPELQSYLDREIIIPQKTGPYPDPKSFKFYEVTIADNGLGIVERLLATRPEYRSHVVTEQDRSRFLNQIIDEALSSKLTQTGAGDGLGNAIRAVRQLRGFLSVRSGSSWVFHSAGDDPRGGSQAQLDDVKHSGPLASLGTHFSLIYPLRSPVTK